MTQGWLGELGRMQPVWSTPSMSTTPTVDRTYKTTLGGRRFVRHAARGHREWDLTGNLASPAEAAVISMMASGAWGHGPFWWLSPWASAVNILTPEGSILKYAELSGAVSGGPVQVSEGLWLPSSGVTSGNVNAIARGKYRGYTAVPKGTMYTASLYVSSGQRVRVSEFDSSLGVVLTTRTSAAGSGNGLTRVSVTSVATAETDALRLDVLGAGVCAGAAISLTGDLRSWGVGDGCAEVIVDSESRDTQALEPDIWMNQKYVIKEVGG